MKALLFAIIPMLTIPVAAQTYEIAGSTNLEGHIPIINQNGDPDVLTRGSAQWLTEMNKRNLQVLYRFNSVSENSTHYIINDVAGVDSNPLNLVIDKSRYTQGQNFFVGGSPARLSIDTSLLMTSQTPATKIANACKATNEVSIELWLKNRFDLQATVTQKVLPLKILSMAKNESGTSTKSANFMIGQGYNNGTLYQMTVRTSSATNAVEDRQDDGILPIGGIVETKTEVPEIKKLQHVVLTRSKDGGVRLYVSYTNDKGEALDAMIIEDAGNPKMQGELSNWFDDAYLALGDELTNSRNGSRIEGLYVDRRGWLGELYSAAIYCDALSPKEVLGPRAPSDDKFQPFSVPLAFNVTEHHKKAALLYKRLVGVKVPITAPIITEMANHISKGSRQDYLLAASLATEEAGFYNITVRDFATKMSNRDETVDAPLNDFVATVIGAVRDDINAKLLLSGNFYYRADESKAAVRSNTLNDIIMSNNHYEDLHNGNFNLKEVLYKESPQVLYDGGTEMSSEVNVKPNPDPAGIITSRAFMESHATAGTNRRLVEYTFREFLCIPMDKWSDGHGPDNFIGRDIDRFPAGEHSKFTSSCRSCHSVMDPLRTAFSGFTFANGFIKNASLLPPNPSNDVDELIADDDPHTMSQNPVGVAYKMNHNSHTFPKGYKIPSGSEGKAFRNYATRGANAAYFGWGEKLSGYGVKQLGQMVANSKAYPKCMTKRVYRSVCKREPTLIEDAAITKIAEEFSSSTNNYNLKKLFQLVAVDPSCIGGNQ